MTASADTASLSVEYLGRTPYREALAYQRAVMRERKAGLRGDTLLLTEHDPVLTLGRRGDRRHIHADAPTLAALGIEVVEVERGGDVTYHGPGQLVAYPIVDLKGYGSDIRRHVRALEACAIRVLGSYGVAGVRRPGAPGVWARDAKVASIGVFISRWVTMHGVALNIDPDLSYFELIDPCGMAGMRITSVTGEIGRAVTVADAAGRFEAAFREVYLIPNARPRGRREPTVR